MFSKPQKHITVFMRTDNGCLFYWNDNYILKVAHAQEQKFTALLGGNQEIPPNTSTAKGSASFNPMGDTVWYKVNVTGIDKVTMMHIHSGKVGENGDPIA